MRRLLNITGELLGLLVLGAIAIALVLMLGGLQRGVNLSSQTLRSPIEAFQSPIESVAEFDNQGRGIRNCR